MDTNEWRTDRGKAHGLSIRECQIITLITGGLTNAEIASETHLSINSVKTYIRSTYRKIGAARRSQAVVWGMRNGFSPAEVDTDERPDVAS